MDHIYSKTKFSLSVYAENLCTSDKKDYLSKLRFIKPDNSVIIIDDPYIITDWKTDMTLWPAVTLADMESYLDKFPGQNTRSKEAYNYVVAGKVHNTCVSVPAQMPELTIVKANVDPSMRTHDPYKSWFISTSDGQIQSAHCTCIAGLGEVCSHVVALMYRVQFAVQSKLTSVPTEKRCEWNNSSRRKVKAAPLKDVSFKKVKLEKGKHNRKLEMVPTHDDRYPSITKEEFESFREIIPDAVIWTSWTDDSSTDSADECQDEIPLPMVDICKLNVITDVQSMLPHFNEKTVNNLEVSTRNQRSLLWKIHRRGRLTASNFGKIIKRRSVTPKFIQIFTDLPKEIYAKQIVWGRKNEIKAFQAYSRIEKTQHDNFSVRKAGLYISLTDPYLGCSPDGIVRCSCCDGSGVLEIKCPFNKVDFFMFFCLLVL